MSSAPIEMKEIPAHQGRTVKIHGHVHSCRDLGNLIFILLRDQSGIGQAVVERQELLAVARQLTAETPACLVGVVAAAPKPRFPGESELRVSEIILLSEPARFCQLKFTNRSRWKIFHCRLCWTTGR